MRKKFNEDAWYVTLIMGFVTIAFTVLVNSNYDDYVLNKDERSIFGKGGKIGLLFLRLLDSYGGKKLVILGLCIIALFFFYRAYRKYKNRYK